MSDKSVSAPGPRRKKVHKKKSLISFVGAELFSRAHAEAKRQEISCAELIRRALIQILPPTPPTT